MRSIPRYRALGRTRDIRRTLVGGLLPVIPLAIALASLTFVFAPQLGRALAHHGRHADTLVPFLRVFAPFIPVATLMAVVLAATRGFGTMVPSVVVNNVGGPGLRPVLVATALALGLGPTGIGLGWIVPFAVGLPLALLWLRHQVRQEEAETLGPLAPPRPSGELAGEFWRFASPRALAAFFQTLITWLDTLLIGALRSTGEAGVYTASTRFVAVGTVLVQTFIVVISPQIAGLLARPEDHPRANALYRSTTTWLVMVTWPIYFTLAVFAPLLLRVFGRDFVAGHTALMVLSFGILYSTSVGPVTAILLMGGKSSWNMFNTVVSLSLNLGLNLLLIPRLGINGAAIAWFVTIFVNNTLPLIEVRLMLGLAPFSATHTFVAATAAVLFGGLGLFTRLALGLSVPTFLGFGLVASGIYAAVVWRNRERLNLSALRESLKLRARAAGSGAG
jgi:O-antigen/teichoic acid export membrane protein